MSPLFAVNTPMTLSGKGKLLYATFLLTVTQTWITQSHCRPDHMHYFWNSWTMLMKMFTFQILLQKENQSYAIICPLHSQDGIRLGSGWISEWDFKHLEAVSSRGSHFSESELYLWVRSSYWWWGSTGSLCSLPGMELWGADPFPSLGKSSIWSCQSSFVSVGPCGTKWKRHPEWTGEMGGSLRKCNNSWGPSEAYSFSNDTSCGLVLSQQLTILCQ